MTNFDDLVDLFADGKQQYPRKYSECKRMGHEWKISWRLIFQLGGWRVWHRRRWSKCQACGIARMGPRLFRRH